MENFDTIGLARALLIRMFELKRVEAIVPELREVGGPVTMLKLHLAAETADLALSDGALTGFYVVDDVGHVTGELILWIEDGRPSALEYAWYTDEPPSALPEPARVVSESPDR